jgi:hypothetical protein
MTATSPIVLESAAQQVAEAFSKPPFLYEMAPAVARKILEDAQSAPVSKLAVDEEWITPPDPVGRRPGTRHQAAGRYRRASGHRVHATAEAGSRQCGDP